MYIQISIICEIGQLNICHLSLFVICRSWIKGLWRFSRRLTRLTRPKPVVLNATTRYLKRHTSSFVDRQPWGTKTCVDAHDGMRHDHFEEKQTGLAPGVSITRLQIPHLVILWGRLCLLNCNS